MLLLLLSRFSPVRLCVTPQTAAHQVPPSLGFSGKNTGVGCHFLLQCMKVKHESEVAQSCPTLCNPMDCSLPGSSVHGIFQASVLKWGCLLHVYRWGKWYHRRLQAVFSIHVPSSFLANSRTLRLFVTIRILLSQSQKPSVDGYLEVSSTLNMTSAVFALLTSSEENVFQSRWCQLTHWHLM